MTDEKVKAARAATIAARAARQQRSEQPRVNVPQGLVKALRDAHAEELPHDRVRVFIEGPGPEGATKFVEVQIGEGFDLGAVADLISAVSAESTDAEMARLAKIRAAVDEKQEKLASFKRG